VRFRDGPAAVSYRHGDYFTLQIRFSSTGSAIAR